MSISSKIKQHLPHEELSVKLWKDEKLKPAIREQLIELGVEINDSSDGTEWKLKS